MKTIRLLFAALSLVANGALSAADAPKATSRVEVVFVQPENFTDAKAEAYNSDRGRAEILAELKSYIERRAPSFMTEGQTLTVRITDIDLAGDFEPWQGPHFDDIRILKDIYSPSMKLEFTLTGTDGKVLAEGKRELRDLGYLMHTVLPSSDGLRYDKELLNDWMRREFRRAP